jgi:DNA repair protein RecO (recombination protein O)
VDDIFDLVVQTLDRLNAPSRLPRADAAWFLMRILEQLGYQPQLQDCPGCGQPLPDDTAWFSPLLGGALCPACGSRAQSGSPLSVTSLKVLRVMAVDDGALYDRLKLSAQVLDEVADALESQLEYHLDRRLKSLDFIRSIRH